MPRSTGSALLRTATRDDIADQYKIVDFNKAVGGDSWSPLVAVGNALYGTTTQGSTYNCGAVFKFVPGAAPTLVYAFKGKPDACYSYGGLIDVRGVLYGTSEVGGAGNAGTVFKVTTLGKETVLHNFAQTGGDGYRPYTALTNVAGVLYGTTEYGGTKQFGAIFSTTQGGDEHVLYSFKGGIDDGANPLGRLTYVDGKLFGTTSSGTRMFAGTVFSITTTGVKKNLHVFDSTVFDDGMIPEGGVTLVDGQLYGTTTTGGAYGGGTIYQLSETGGGYNIVYSFSSIGEAGTSPANDLLYLGSNLFGTTIFGGTHLAGGVFAVSLQGQETTLHSFAGARDGSTPDAGLTYLNGLLYGTTTEGGATKAGVIYELSP